MTTLWDLAPTKRILAWLAGRPPRCARPGPPAARPRPVAPARGARRHETDAQTRYDALVERMLKAHGVRVRKWRTSMSGIAWEVACRDGTTTRLIEAPRPRGPMSAAVFLHEIGHHAIGFNVYRPRCLEEYHAWAWAIREMERAAIPVTERVRYRMHQSLAYAVAKANRRGLRALPPELEPFARPLPRRHRPR